MIPTADNIPARISESINKLDLYIRELSGVTVEDNKYRITVIVQMGIKTLVLVESKVGSITFSKNNINNTPGVLLIISDSNEYKCRYYNITTEKLIKDIPLPIGESSNEKHLTVLPTIPVEVYQRMIGEFDRVITEVDSTNLTSVINFTSEYNSKVHIDLYKDSKSGPPTRYIIQSVIYSDGGWTLDAFVIHGGSNINTNENRRPYK